eukprot:m.159278 g.159278  ORF g.159278 m.159278 type:complete len:161 (+) comp38764_c0_seq93:151-633(+)
MAAIHSFRPEYVALLRLAYAIGNEEEYPLKTTDIVACLEGALTVCPPSSTIPEEEATVRFELAKLLFHQSSGKDKAKIHLERAHELHQTAKIDPDRRAEVIGLLSSIYMEKKNHEMAIEVLRGGRKSPPDQLSLWSVRLMLLLGVRRRQWNLLWFQTGPP